VLFRGAKPKLPLEISFKSLYIDIEAKIPKIVIMGIN